MNTWKENVNHSSVCWIMDINLYLIANQNHGES